MHKSSSAAQYKKFSHSQIRDKVARRANVPEYYDLLMSCAVKEDEEGIVFDSGAEGWKKLVLRCEQADHAQAKENKKKQLANININNNNNTTNSQPINPSSNSSNTLTRAIGTATSSLIKSVQNFIPQSPQSPLSPNNNNNNNNDTSNGSNSNPISSDWVSINKSNNANNSNFKPKLTPKNSRDEAGSPVNGKRSENTTVNEDIEFETRLLAELEQTEADALANLFTLNSSDELMKSFIKELQAPNPNIAIIKQACKLYGIPHKFRAKIWTLLLNENNNSNGESNTDNELLSPVDSENSSIGANSSSNSNISNEHNSVKTDLHNQRVIRADIDRTFGHLTTFQQPTIKTEMEQVLTHYCKSHVIGYKQGMNYILAPFFLLGLNNQSDSRFIIQKLYSKFISRQLTSTFQDSEFGSIQCVFSLFRLLILYHDPELCNFLDRNDLGPELYASSWFITLFSNRCKLEIVFYLWDSLLIECNSPFDNQLLYFVSLSLLLSHRSAILIHPIVQLPELLSKLSITNKEEVKLLIQRAKKIYRAQTSYSVQNKLQEITTRLIEVDSTEYRTLLAQPCLSVTPHEIIQHLYSDYTNSNNSNSNNNNNNSNISTSNNSNSVSKHHKSNSKNTQTNLKYFIVDCRNSLSYESGHLPCSYNLDPDLIGKPEELEKKIEGLQSMKGCHYVFLADNLINIQSTIHTADTQIHNNSKQLISNSPQQLLIQFVLKRGFKYISILEGGYSECHKIITNSPNKNLELIDHNSEMCIECVQIQQNKILKQQQQAQLLAEQHPPHSEGKKTRSSRVLGAVKRAINRTINQDHTTTTADTIMSTSTINHKHTDTNSTTTAVEIEYPEGTHVLSSTLYSRLLITSLRDANTEPNQFTQTLYSLTSFLLGETINERIDSKEKNVTNSHGNIYSGVELMQICTITINPEHIELNQNISELLLNHAFQPIYSLTKRFIAKLQWQHQAHKHHSNNNNYENTPTPQISSSLNFLIGGDMEESTKSMNNNTSSNSNRVLLQQQQHAQHPVRSIIHADLPEATQCSFFIFQPILTVNHISDLLEILNLLVTNRSIETSQITVISLIIARPVLWSVTAQYPELHFLTLSVDEYSQGKLIPGVANLESRFQFPNNKIHNNQRTVITSHTHRNNHFS